MPKLPPSPVVVVVAAVRVPVGAAVNHQLSLSPVFNLASAGLTGCACGQFGFSEPHRAEP